MRSHAANPERSTRLQKLIRYLSTKPNGATTLELCWALSTTNPARDASEVNASGLYRIETEFQGTNKNGRRVYRFRLIK